MNSTTDEMDDLIFEELSNFSTSEFESKELEDSEFSILDYDGSQNTSNGCVSFPNIPAKWSTEEDAALKQAVETYGAKNWKNVILIAFFNLYYYY